MSFDMLKQRFFTLCQSYCEHDEYIQKCYQELLEYYGGEGRYYHTLEHVASVFHALEGIELSPALVFSIYYHDVIYDVHSSENESKSASFCKDALQYLSVGEGVIKKACQIILDTKTHIPTSKDSLYMIDADLFVFAGDERSYKKACEQIRNEYSIYDDLTYAKGRIKVLDSFLRREKIYLSEYFAKHEVQARRNISEEIAYFQNKIE